MASVPPGFKFTAEMISQSRIIARGMGIRDIRRLVGTYGGSARDWTKKSSQVVMIESRRAEVHWYECHGIGRFEPKVKWVDVP